MAAKEVLQGTRAGFMSSKMQIHPSVPAARFDSEQLHRAGNLGSGRPLSSVLVEQQGGKPKTRSQYVGYAAGLPIAFVLRCTDAARSTITLASVLRTAILRGLCKAALNQWSGSLHQVKKNLSETGRPSRLKTGYNRIFAGKRFPLFVAYGCTSLREPYPEGVGKKIIRFVEAGDEGCFSGGQWTPGG